MEKAIIIITLASIINSVVLAQNGKYGATPEDSVKCVQNLSLYIEFYKQKNYQDAITPWNWLIANCPKSSKKMYANGVVLMNYMINKEKDADRKERLIDRLMMIYDQRIKYFGQEGFVLGKKGVDMLQYRKDKPGEAFEVLKRSVELEDKESQAGTVTAYFQLSAILLEQEKLTKEDIIGIFDKVSGIIDYNLFSITDENKKKYYQTAKENVEILFAPIASCEDLVKLYSTRFDENSGNADWLKRATRMMDNKGCTEDPVFVKLSETLHSLDPSALSAYNIGKMLIGRNQYSKASIFLKQAIELEEENNTKAEYFLTLANLYFSNLKQYSQARTYAQKAIALRSGWGIPYILIGDMYSSTAKECGENEFEQSAVYWAAVDKYIQAKNVDSSVIEDANKKIATWSKYFPNNKDAFFYGGFSDGQSYTVGCWINETTTVRVQ
ncbi:MAG: hypothetical protein ABII90_04390 [Bacteroidota bacterium]